MRRLNPEHVARVVALVNQGPYIQLLNMRVVELGWGSSLVTADLERKHHNPFGGVHGGTCTSLIDTAAFWSAYCQMAEDQGFITVDVNVNTLAAVKEGRLAARGRCLKMGRTLCLTEALVTDPEGRLVAHGTSKMVAVPELMNISQAVKAMGGQPLPPKFLD
ncbi:MAG: PaaI family thioesterase [Desulfarculus sp.]|nr:MAG: PaaI family thioesterase [Desulfarculus sp.]